MFGSTLYSLGGALGGPGQATSEVDMMPLADTIAPTEAFQVMTADQLLSVDLVLDDEDDFRLCALQWSLQGLDDLTSVPGFLYRIRDDQGHFIQEGMIYCYATPGTFANPWPMFPHVTYPVHHRIQFDIQNLNDDIQGVQLVFRGKKRFRRVG